MLQIQTILHATDLSECSRYAFYLACSLARDYSAKLVVVSIAPPPVLLGGEGLVPPPESDIESLRKELAQMVKKAALPRTECLVAEGDAATEILRLAKDTKCDVIVMGTHGRTGFGRLVMGSVADQVLRQATCPVLTVKTPHREESKAS